MRPPMRMRRACVATGRIRPLWAGPGPRATLSIATGLAWVSGTPTFSFIAGRPRSSGGELMPLQ